MARRPILLSTLAIAALIALASFLFNVNPISAIADGVAQAAGWSSDSDNRAAGDDAFARAFDIDPHSQGANAGSQRAHLRKSADAAAAHEAKASGRYMRRSGGGAKRYPRGGNRGLRGAGGEGQSLDGEVADGADASETGNAEDDEDGDASGDESAEEDDASAQPLTLTGTVEDDAGMPVAEALVSLSADGTSKQTKSDAGGTFQFPGLSVGESFVLSASKAGYLTGPSSTRSSAPDQGGVRKVGALTLKRNMAISGRVLRADGGLANAARVTLSLRNDGGRFSSLNSDVTGADGRFDFGGLGDGEYRIEVEHAGHSGRYENNIKAPRDIEIKLETSSAIEGKIVNQLGEPVSNASVHCELRTEPDLYFSFRSRSEQDGSFKVECAPGSVHNTLTFAATGHSKKVLKLIPAGKKLDVTLEPNDKAVVRGSVTFGDGRHPNVVNVRIDSKLDGKLQRSNQTFTFSGNSAARFELEFTPFEGGQHTVVISSPEFKTTKIELGGVRQREALDLGEILVQGGLTIAGRVLIGANNGKPAADARVVLPSGVGETTDAQGRFSFSGLDKNSSVLLTARLQGYPVASHEVELGDKDIKNLVVVIPYGERALKGRVVSAASKEPIAGASVKIVNEGAPAVLTDSDGRYLIENALRESVKLRITHPEFATGEVISATASPDEAVIEAPLAELVPGASIHGTLTRAIDGEAVRSGVSVKIYRGSNAIASATTGLDGSYASEPLEAGVYFVEVPEFHLPPRRVEHPGAKGVKLDLSLRGTITVRGRVLLASGRGHGSAGIYVYWHSESAVFDTVYTDPSGNFEIHNVWPGTFSLAILKHPSDQAAQWVEEISVIEGLAEQDVIVQLPAADAVIEGRVTYPDGQPVVGARVSITNLNSRMDRAVLAGYTVTDNQGYYRATRLEENAPMDVRVGGYDDNAATGLAFADRVTTGSGGSVTRADISVTKSGVTVRIPCVRADGGPLITNVTGILFDEQGRRAGNFFGTTLTLLDIVPGRYELVAYSAGMKSARVTLVVNDGGSYSLIGAQRIEFELDPEYG